MNKAVIEAVKQLIEHIEQDTEEIDRGGMIETRHTFGPIGKIVIEQHDEYWDNDRRPDSWKVSAYDRFGAIYKYSWYVTVNGDIIADGS